ncbi:MAG: DUF5317 domain-containing protein [Dehalococcoidia bacterium]
MHMWQVAATQARVRLPRIERTMPSRGWPMLRIKLGLIALGALGLQAVVVYTGIGQTDYLSRSFFILSYLLLFVFVWANRRHLGVSVIGVGLLLNFVAIAANGGLMPISPETLVRAGLTQQLPQLEIGEPVPHTKNIVLEQEDMSLWFLSDILALDNPLGVRAFSVGDTVIGAGLVVTLAQLLLPRRKGAPASDEQAA